MALLVPNRNVPLVDNKGCLLPGAWTSFFQQFVQAPSAAVSLIVDISPFTYSCREPGLVAIVSGTISKILLIRGSFSIDITGSKIIPVSIKDIVQVTYSVLPVIQFLPNL